MANAIITIQLGQCGNQIGFEYWKHLCLEHGINSDGDMDENFAHDVTDARDVVFYTADNDRYVPRAVLVDLEPRVINTIMNSEYAKLFTQENVYVSKEGGGSGNNWAKGYSVAQKLEEDVFEIIEHIAENCDSLGGLTICHSVAGGTGSGVGSYFLERLADCYPKVMKQTYSVFPPQVESGDVVVQAYNALLTLERLANCADTVMVLDNAALQRIVVERMKVSQPSLAEINGLITKVMTMATNPLRFPTYQYNTLSSMMVPLLPSSSMHFLTASYVPWNVETVRKENLQRLVYDLLKPYNMVVSAAQTRSFEHGYLAVFDIIQGKYEAAQLSTSIANACQSKLAKFVPWAPQWIHATFARYPPCLPEPSSHSGLMIANHTGVSSYFGGVVQQFDRLRKRRAFLEQFRSAGVFSENFEEMDLARDVVDCAIQEYEAATGNDFCYWGPKKRVAIDLTELQATKFNL